MDNSEAETEGEQPKEEEEEENEENSEGDPEVKEVETSNKNKPYTFKVFRSNNGKCIADGLKRRGNWREVTSLRGLTLEGRVEAVRGKERLYLALDEVQRE